MREKKNDYSGNIHGISSFILSDFFIFTLVLLFSVCSMLVYADGHLLGEPGISIRVYFVHSFGNVCVFLSFPPPPCPMHLSFLTV